MALIKRRLIRAGAVVGAGAGAAAAGAILIRRWQLGFGATVEEILRAMPLDDRIANPNHVTTRAITIHAPPEAIWPWLSQAGELVRGRFYSYVTVERRLRPPGGLIVQTAEAYRHLVLGPEPGRNLRVTWSLALFPAPDGTTRLVSRCRAWMRPGVERLAWRVILDAGQLLMERRLLLEIRPRSERPPNVPPVVEDRRSTVA